MGDGAEPNVKDSEFLSLGKIREDFFTLTKARLSFLVVITAVFGYLVATKGNGSFSWVTLIDLLIGATLSAFGAAVFNQLMEIEPDARMSRTSDRPLPAKRIPQPLAFIIGWLLCAFGIIHLALKVDIYSSGMAAATLLTYLFIYTPMKKVSSFNTIVGAVSGAFPPLIGWCAGPHGLFEFGALFLFLLLFFWQLPHFAAINWMYREEYLKGGFKMWSNDDETGQKTGRIALVSAIFTVLFIVIFPFMTGLLSWPGILLSALLGGTLIAYALAFLKSGQCESARKLFFYTLIYLPAMMLVSYLTWR